MIRSPLLILCAALAGCTAQQTQLVTIDTCQTNAAVVSSLADVKSKLTPAQVDAVNKDIAVIDPICSAPTPPASLTGLAGSAAQDLATILAGIQK